MSKLIKMKDIPERMLLVNEENIKNIPKLWDIFTFSINPWEYMFGRIIYIWPKAFWCNWNIWEEKIIYYFYNIKYNEKYLKDFSILTLDKLLTWPIISYKDYFELWYFEVIGNQEITNKNVHFPICFEHKERIQFWEWYTDQDDNIIEKQKICWFWAISNIFWIQYDILKALWEPIPETKHDKEKFNLFDTNAWFDYWGLITKKTKPNDLYEKIKKEEYYTKWYYFDSYDALEAMVDIEVLIFTYLKRELENLKEEFFPWIYEFWNKYDKTGMDREIFIKAKKLLEIILNKKTSELAQLREEKWRYKFLKKWVEKRVLLIEQILETPIEEKKKFLGLF